MKRRHEANICHNSIKNLGIHRLHSNGKIFLSIFANLSINSSACIFEQSRRVGRRAELNHLWKIGWKYRTVCIVSSGRRSLCFLLGDVELFSGPKVMRRKSSINIAEYLHVTVIKRCWAIIVTMLELNKNVSHFSEHNLISQVWFLLHLNDYNLL